MKDYAGLKVSMKETATCIVDKSERICREAKVVSHPESLIEWIGGGAADTVLGLENGHIEDWMPAATEKRRETYHHGDLRTAMIDAAEAELTAGGLSGFPLRKVAYRVGVSHSAPSHHFGDTQGLLVALGVRAFGQVLAAMQARSNDLTDPSERVIASGLGYIDFAKGSPAMFRLVFESDLISKSATELDRAGEAAFNHFAQAIKTATVEQLSEDIASWEAPAFLEKVYTAWTVTRGFAEMILSGQFDCLGSDGDARVEQMYRRAIVAVL